MGVLNNLNIFSFNNHTWKKAELVILIDLQAKVGEKKVAKRMAKKTESLA